MLVILAYSLCAVLSFRPTFFPMYGGGNLQKKDLKKKERNHAFDQEKSKKSRSRQRYRPRKKLKFQDLTFFFYKFPALSWFRAFYPLIYKFPAQGQFKLTNSCQKKKCRSCWRVSQARPRSGLWLKCRGTWNQGMTLFDDWALKVKFQSDFNKLLYWLIFNFF